MVTIFRVLNRPFIWLYRLRYRCGYGVHSPFAFELITCLIYEQTPYYAYEMLAEEEQLQRLRHPKTWLNDPLRIKRLLFRLVNRMQPNTIVDAGVLTASSLYLQAGKKKAVYTFAAELSDLFLEADVPVDFAYLHKFDDPDFVEDVFRICAERTTSNSVFVIRGIHDSRGMKKLWKRLKASENTGITFDLYDVGIVFFDKTKIKQHYIVNF